MKLRNLTLLLAAGLGTVTVASTVVTVATLLDNRQLRREVREARLEGNRAAAEARRQEEQDREVAARDEQLRNRETELAELQSRATNNAPAPAAAARPVRVRTYLGQRYLGLAWIVPGQAAKDPATGQMAYEPVVLMDESIREAVGVSKTNVVEREVVRPTTVNYNYSYPYQIWWPVVWAPATKPKGGSPPRSPRIPPPGTRAPQDGEPFLSTKFYQPPEKPFLPSLPPSTRPGPGNASAGGGSISRPGLNTMSSARTGPQLLPQAR
jgi:hypothetical protein